MKHFALAMSALYVAAGLALLFTNALIGLIPRFRMPLGLLLAAYGVVRFVLWRRKHAQDGNA